MSSREQRRKLANSSKKRVVHIKTRKYPAHKCPDCNAVLDGITGISEDKNGTIPTVGSITVCAYCGVALEITNSGFAFTSKGRFIKKAGREYLNVIESMFKKRGIELRFFRRSFL